MKALVFIFIFLFVLGLGFGIGLYYSANMCVEFGLYVADRIGIEINQSQFDTVFNYYVNHIRG